MQTSAPASPSLVHSLSLLLPQFPPTAFLAAYGSAVFPSSSSSSSPSDMIDILVGVEDVSIWHSANLSLHPDHYSFLRWLGPGIITAVNQLPAYVYYNTHVSMSSIDDTSNSNRHPLSIKYGVISIHNMCSDLTQWNTLYTAGRMQKPLCVVRADPRVDACQSVNLSSALSAALLLSPSPSLSSIELFTLLCALSYGGDVRMGVAEDPDKIRKIVQYNTQAFHSMYADTIIKHKDWIQEDQHTRHPTTDKKWRVNHNPETRASMMIALPESIQMGVFQQAVTNNSLPGNDHFTLAASFSQLSLSTQQRLIRSTLRDVVRSSSAAQTIKGLLTAGVRKSLSYGLRKIGKAWNR